MIPPGKSGQKEKSGVLEPPQCLEVTVIKRKGKKLERDPKEKERFEAFPTGHAQH